MRRALVVLLSLLLAALLSLSSVSAQRESYNEPLARRLLSFSTAAYCKEADLQAWNCGEYCDQLSTFRIAGTVNPVISWEAPLLSFAGVDTDPETGAKNLLLVFRGTYPLSLVAWFDDARFQPASLPQLCETCVAPWGFLDLWHNLRDGTMSMMRRLIHDHPDLPLTITGHSLGGALAMLAAIDISAEFNKQANTSVGANSRQQAAR